MKTKQEQIEKLAQLIGRIKDDCENCDCKSCEVNGEDCCCVHYICATFLVDAGYGDVSEYKSEIERLKSNNGFLQSVISHSKDMMDESVKQAQTDTINTIIKYCENPNHWRELKDCKLWGGKSYDLRNFLSGIFKEVKEQ